MKESTRSKLTIFARWWGISLVLSVVLNILAVIAGINEHTSWMTLAVLGNVVMLAVMLAQLVAAVLVRRWWHVAGITVAVLLSLFVSLCCIVALAAGQYRPPKNTDVDSDSLSVVTTFSTIPNE